MKHYTIIENFEYITALGIASILLTPFLFIFSNDLGLALVSMLLMGVCACLVRWCRPVRKMYYKLLIATRRK